MRSSMFHRSSALAAAFMLLLALFTASPSTAGASTSQPTSWTGSSAITGLTSPQTIAAQGGHVFVLEAGSPTVVTERSSDGTVLATFGTVGDPLAGADWLGSIAVDPTGTYLYVADSGHNRLVRFTIADGSQLDSNLISFPTGVAVSADGSVLFTDYYVGTVSRISADLDTASRVDLVTGLNLPIAVGDDVAGNIYFSSSDAGGISKIPTGTTTPVSLIDMVDICNGAPSGLTVNQSNGSIGVGTTGCLYALVASAAGDVSMVAPNNSHFEPYRSVVFGSGVVYALGAWSNSIWALTPPAPTAPAAPRSMSTTPGNTTASIAFTPGSDGGSAITKYQYRIGNGTWKDAGATAPILVTGLVNYTNSTVRVRAINAVGVGSASAPIVVGGRLGGPTLADATAVDSSRVHVTFSGVTIPRANISGYTAYAYDIAFPDSIAGSCRAGRTASSCDIRALDPGTDYEIRVVAYFKFAGNGTPRETLPSNAILVTTLTAAAD